MAIKKGLGRGLESLFAMYDEEVEQTNPTPKAATPNTKGGVDMVDMNLIKANPNQPRKHFDEDALNELAASIRLHGVIQPIVINDNEDGTYIIIAGERRFRAARKAGLENIPAVIKKYSDKQIKEIAIIENLQREDLNPIEAARAIKQLMEEYNLTQEAVAERIGKSRPNIANVLRLLTLYPDVMTMVEEGKLSSGHARALVVVEDHLLQVKLANQAIKDKWTVRELEKAGLRYNIDGDTLKVSGVTGYSPSIMEATDLRGGAALIGAALNARGRSEILNAEYIQRGYSEIVRKLAGLGADIEFQP